MLNLLLNGIEALESKGKLNIETIEKDIRKQKYSVIRINDNGIGINEKDIDHIFEPFYSTKHDDENRGLGLTICKDIVSQYNGFINVQSTNELGTTFEACLPS